MSKVPKPTRRIWESDAALDAQEHQWWNDNAAVVSSVWEMHDEVSRAIRRPYMNRARGFFQKSGSVVNVLELGCGSGWVGQMIAGPSLNIRGTDFSESQIDLASENASRKNLTRHCTYSVSSPDAPTNTDDIDGVLIHCFLHHLNGKELDGLLAGLRDNLSPGTKVWICEPAFFLSPGEVVSPRMAIRILLACASRVTAILSWSYSTLSLTDRSVQDRYLPLADQAESEGWYLTPKEVPLDVEGFSVDLERCFEVRAQYWATVYFGGWAHQTNLLRSGTLRQVVIRTVFPFLGFVDRKLSRADAYLRSQLVAPNYAFHVWECESK